MAVEKLLGLKLIVNFNVGTWFGKIGLGISVSKPASSKCNLQPWDFFRLNLGQIGKGRCTFSCEGVGFVWGKGAGQRVGECRTHCVKYIVNVRLFCYCVC